MSGRAVIDSTCLIALERIDRLDLLPRLFSEIFAPRLVAQEFGRVPAWLRVQEIRDRTLVSALRTQLDAGEREVIALATELAGFVAVLDDKKAPRIAHEMELKVMGTMGLLVNAKRRGLVLELKPVLDNLDDVGFRLSRELRQEALRLAGEDA